MTRAVRIEQHLASQRQFQALADFLELLGLAKETAAEAKQQTHATFSLPIGRIRFYWDKRKNERPAQGWSLAIEVDDFDTACELIRRKGYAIIADRKQDQTGKERLVVEVVSDLRIALLRDGEMRVNDKTVGGLRAKGLRFGIVVSRFNSFITERLLQGARDALLRLGAQTELIDIVRVPGSFEIPSAARTLAETKKYDAVLCIGCLLRGDTAHYDVISNEVARGIGQSAQETGVPHAFAVLTCDTLEQAIERAGLKQGNKGFEAALCAVEMANLTKAVRRQSSTRLKNQKVRQSAPSKRSKPSA